ncbi:uncharacterized protein TRAVEDRAFT_25143, partial [Trametes versicolor FP-101664 SS1]
PDHALSLQQVLRLRLPHETYFKYMVCLVGPGLRPAYPDLYITPDMCILILPNTGHPMADREALRSDPPFPFGNFYHWSASDMRLDIRVVNDGRDYGVGPRTTLPVGQHVKMVGIQNRDMWLSSCARKERDGTQHVAGVPVQAEERDSQPLLVESMRRERSCTSAQSPSPAVIVKDIGYVGINEYGELEVSLDVGAHFKGDTDVPNRMEFMRQRDALIRIIEESKLLAKKALEDTKSIIAA